MKERAEEKLKQLKDLCVYPAEVEVRVGYIQIHESAFVDIIAESLQAVRAEAFEEAAEIVYYSDARKEERRVPLSELYEQLRAKAKGYSGGEIRIGWEGKLGND